MKIAGQLIIALAGGIIAILLYRMFDRDTFITERPAPRNSLNRTVVYHTEGIDSINNVFSIGFGEAAESSLNQVVHIRARTSTSVRPSPSNPFRDFFGDEFWGQLYRQQPRQMQEASGSGVIISSRWIHCHQ